MTIRGLLVELSAPERRTLLRIAHGDAHCQSHDSLHLARLLSLQLVDETRQMLALTQLGTQRVEWLGSGPMALRPGDGPSQQR